MVAADPMDLDEQARRQQAHVLPLLVDVEQAGRRRDLRPVGQCHGADIARVLLANEHLVALAHHDGALDLALLTGRPPDGRLRRHGSIDGRRGRVLCRGRSSDGQHRGDGVRKRHQGRP